MGKICHYIRFSVVAILAFLMMGVCASLAGQIQYDYDVLGRLVEASYSSNTMAQYRYDPAGNLTELETVRDTDADGLSDDWENTCFGSLTNATSETDSDDDGLTDKQESELGSDPLDAKDGLCVANLKRETAQSGFAVRWASQTNRFYRVESASNLLDTFTALATDIPGTPPVNVYTDDHVVVDRAFYRVELETSP